MPITRTWTIVGSAAVAIGVVGGVALASDGLPGRDQPSVITLKDVAPEDLAGEPVPTAPEDTVITVDTVVDTTPDSTEIVAAMDLSPESADSPNESPFDSPESPYDSPDDEGWVDFSPESADSPNESPFDSPVSPDTPASPASPDTPASPASPATPASPASPASPESADSPD